jgi:hypothetical protein
MSAEALPVGTFIEEESAFDFPNNVQKTVEGAVKYRLQTTNRTYGTGRPIVLVLFYDAAGDVIATRDGMSHISKRTGRVFYSCAIDAASE